MTEDSRKHAPEALDDTQMDKAQGGGREDQIKVLATSHEITSPRDTATGLPTGRRRHKPLMI